MPVVSKRMKPVICLIFIMLLLIGLLVIEKSNTSPASNMIMGGILYTQFFDDEEENNVSKEDRIEKYFRPSDLSVLNDRFTTTKYLNQYYNSKASEIVLPKELMKSPEETIVNYYSVLRDAANWEEGKNAGCGTIGYSTTPYPIAYNFLSSSYQKKLSYKEYLDSFKNILHISLIKYKEVPVYNNPSSIRSYFIEIETIGGSDNNSSNFTYYYGFIDFSLEDNQYKISNLEFTGEDFLCAPFHGWSHNAEANVQIRYGNWCKMIKKLYPTIQQGYVKHLYFTGTDGNEYLIEFYQLTNNTDIEIAQYKEDKAGSWKLIKLTPENCIKTPSTPPKTNTSINQ